MLRLEEKLIPELRQSSHQAIRRHCLTLQAYRATTATDSLSGKLVIQRTPIVHVMSGRELQQTNCVQK